MCHVILTPLLFKKGCILSMDSVYCTIVSKSRLYQFLSLIVSLTKVRDGNFQFFVLCVDDHAYNLLNKLNWKNVNLFHEKEVSEYIVSLKKDRKIHEYCWTLKGVFIEAILNQYPEVMRVTYMDSDLYFWGDPEWIFNNQSNCSVLLSKEEKFNPEWTHKFTKRIKKITGEYNSGFISFKRSELGNTCLKWWKEKLLEYCKIDFKKGTFGDQKYLNEMPELFEGVCDIATPGVNIGPWNYLKYQFTNKKNQVFIDQNKLIFYHFSGVRVIKKQDKIEFTHYSEKNTPFVYDIYFHVLSQIIKMVEQVDPEFNGFATEEDLKSYW